DPNQPSAAVPYLMDCRGAATVFRFPVSLESGVCGFDIRHPIPHQSPGALRREPSDGELVIGDSPVGGTVTVPVSEVTRHCLITGTTGSGKTNTVLFLVDQLWRGHPFHSPKKSGPRRERIPFLLIEAAKREYRSLIKSPCFGRSAACDDTMDERFLQIF